MNFENYSFIKIAGPLQEWFVSHARVLPWREQQTPYHVWISEIMLQQTRVEAVISYYNRFLEKLPDIRSLAEAEEETCLKLWEGLGYYSRVRNLHKAAVQVMEQYDGRLPSSCEELLKLPGIGAYTAGAVSSLAYGNRVPAVDGNVLRVMMRIAGDDSDISAESTKKRLQNCLQALYGQDEKQVLDPRKYNQGLMELGALVCVPNGKPDCENCPVRAFCEAYKNGLTEVLPVKAPKKERRIEDRTVLILADDARTAIHKRPEKGLLAGLWELPNPEGHFTPEEAARFVRSMGFSPLFIERLEDAKHIFSHVEWHMRGYRIRIEEEAFATKEQLECREKEGIFFTDSKDLAERITMPSAFAAYRKYL